MHHQIMDNQHMKILFWKKYGHWRKYPNLKPQCHKYLYLMKDFIRELIQGGELIELDSVQDSYEEQEFWID